MNGGGFTISNHAWKVSGYTFKSVEYGPVGPATVPPPSTYRGYRRIHYLTSTDLSLPTVAWYWEEGDAIRQVECTFNVYMGSTLVGAGSCIRHITVWNPYYFYGWHQGRVVYTPSNVNAESIKAGDEEVWPFVGMEFVGAVSVPSFFGAGEWAFAQTCKLYRHQSGLHPIPQTTILQDFWLDNSWPYSVTFDAPTDVSEAPEWPTDDSPDYGIFWFYNHVEVSDDFRMFEIFRPPFGPGMHGTEWVSLHLLEWHWEGSGDEGPGNVWSGPNGIVLATGHQPYRHRLLQWERVYPNDY